MKCTKNVLTVILVATLLSSCSLFRKKNKCNTCPTWDSIELAEIGPNQYDSEN